MNIRNVLRTYGLLRQLTDDEAALLGTLRALSDNDREQLIETLAPDKPARKPAAQQRKIEHCAVCDYTKRAAVHKDAVLKDYHQFQSSKPKSVRAASLAQQIKGAVEITLCSGSLTSSGAACGLAEGHALHADKNYVDYHPFVPPAQPATPQSPPNGAGDGLGASSETEKAGVRNVVHEHAAGIQTASEGPLP